MFCSGTFSADAFQGPLNHLQCNAIIKPYYIESVSSLFSESYYSRMVTVNRNRIVLTCKVDISCVDKELCNLTHSEEVI